MLVNLPFIEHWGNHQRRGYIETIKAKSLVTTADLIFLTMRKNIGPSPTARAMSQAIVSGVGRLLTARDLSMAWTDLHRVMEAPVLLVEGEKSADAANELVGEDMVCMTWPGGSKAVGKADFTPVQNRQLIIWPDNDKPGFEAALTLAKVMTEIGAIDVLFVEPPVESKSTWDLADAHEQGWMREQVLEWIKQHSLNAEEFLSVYRKRFQTDKPDTLNIDNDRYSEEPGEPDEGLARFLPTPPPFPLTTLPENYQKIVKQAALAFNVPAAIPATALISLVSTCAGYTRGLQFKSNWTEYPNLYIALVASSGTGKTPCTQEFFKPLFDIEQENFLLYNMELEKFNQFTAEVKRDKSKPKKDFPKKPQMVQHYIDDATIESVSDAMICNPKGVLWLQDELAGLLKSMGRYSPKGDDASIKSRLNSAHGCGSWKVNRKSNGVVNIRNACLSIFGTIQPEILPHIFSDHDAVSGFLPRFLFVRAETESPPLFTEEEFGTEQQAALLQLTKYLLSFGFDEKGKPILVKLSTEAKNIYVPWHNRQATEQWYSVDSGLEKSCLAKLRGHCLRLCLILHIIEMADQKRDVAELISAETMRRAIELADWFKMQQMQVMQLWKDNNVSEINTLEKSIMEAILLLEDEVDKGMLPTAMIAEKVNEGIGDSFKFDTAVVGKCCKNLGLHGKKMTDGKSRGFQITEKDLDNFRKFIKTAVQSVQSVQNSSSTVVSEMDSNKNCRPSRPKGSDQSLITGTAGTADKNAVQGSNPNDTKASDRLDSMDGKNSDENNISSIVPDQTVGPAMPPGEWVTFSAVDDIKDPERRSEVVSAFLKNDLESVGIVTCFDEDKNQLLLRKDTLEISTGEEMSA